MDEEGQAEVLLVSGPARVRHRAGIAGHERALMSWQQFPQVVEIFQRRKDVRIAY